VDNGLQFSVSVTEFALSAILIVVLALGVGYEYTHRTYPPVAAAPCPAPIFSPTISIQPTITIPAPAPVAVTPPDEFTPDPNLEKPEQQDDPVFQHREPIITSALRDPMPR
jgi:hypothetical protein